MDNVIDFAAAKRRVIATRMRKVQRCDNCHVCGRPIDAREALCAVPAKGVAAHVRCWFLASRVPS